MLTCVFFQPEALIYVSHLVIQVSSDFDIYLIVVVVILFIVHFCLLWVFSPFENFYFYWQNWSIMCLQWCTRCHRLIIFLKNVVSCGSISVTFLLLLLFLWFLAAHLLKSWFESNMQYSCPRHWYVICYWKFYWLWKTETKQRNEMEIISF